MPKKDYSTWTKEELIQHIHALKKRKKYGLVWDEERTKERFEKDTENKLPVLTEVKEKEIRSDKNEPVHILIEGDNYHALSVLNYTHKKAVDLIFIDPPYNTGSSDGEQFRYNDKIVNKEDSFRHSKWLSFMSKRLRLAKNILKRSGLIFITIDDNEYAQLKLMCDEIFLERNFITNIVWHSRQSVSNDSIISQNHNHILFYCRDIDYMQEAKHLFRLPTDLEKFSNPDNDPNGDWIADPFDAPNIRENLTYPITNPTTGKIYYPPKGRCWRTTEARYKEFLKKGMIVFGKKGISKPQLKRYKKDVNSRSKVPTSWWDDVGTTTEGSKELKKIFGNIPFNNPKPTRLTDRIIELSLQKEGVVLDFFAGSGSTGHSVLKMNNSDNGKRQFILCTNNENKICDEVTYPRIKRLMEGYSDSEIEVKKLKGNLRYYKTAFVPATQTDQNKELLTKQSVEMLCLRENTFDFVEETDIWKLYRSKQKHTGILFDQTRIQEFKEKLKMLTTPISVYVFSLGDDDFADEFSDMKNVKVCSIPEVILRVYRKIFK